MLLMNKIDFKNKEDEFLLEKTLEEKAPRTLDHYKYVLDLLLECMPDDKAITKMEMLGIKEKFYDLGFSNSTYNNYITVIDSFFKFCACEDLCLKKRKVQIKGSLKNVLEPLDYKRLLRWADKLCMSECKLIMMVLAETGIRVAELKYFTVEAVKQGNYIEVTNKGKSRNIIVKNSLRKELKNYVRNQNIKTGYIFRSRKYKNRPAVEKTIWREMKKVATHAKVSKEKVHPHSFRHLFALRWLEQGGSLPDLADMLGHTSIETTRIYAKTTDEMKKQMLEKMRYKGM